MQVNENIGLVRKISPDGRGGVTQMQFSRDQMGTKSLTLLKERDTLIKFGAAAHVSLSQGLQGRQA